MKLEKKNKHNIINHIIVEISRYISIISDFLKLKSVQFEAFKPYTPTRKHTKAKKTVNIKVVFLKKPIMHIVASLMT